MYTLHSRRIVHIHEDNDAAVSAAADDLLLCVLLLLQALFLPVWAETEPQKKLNFLPETQFFAETEPKIIEELNFSRFSATKTIRQMSGTLFFHLFPTFSKVEGNFAEELNFFGPKLNFLRQNSIFPGKNSMKKAETQFLDTFLQTQSQKRAKRKACVSTGATIGSRRHLIFHFA